MSTEEEVELRDLVTEALEVNGCLPKIRAQLRANLFLTLNEEQKITKEKPLLNKKIKSYLDSPQGQLMFCLVREFLEFFQLEFTASVYEPETYLDNFYKYEGREKVIDDLKLDCDNLNGPVLLHVINIAQTKSKTVKINLTATNCEQQNGTTKKFDSTFIKKDCLIENDDTFNGTSSIEEDTNSVDNTDNCHKESESEQDSPKSKSSQQKTKKLDHHLNKNLLPNLYYNKEFKEKSQKDYDFEIKDDYEEDFMSSSELEFSQKDSTEMIQNNNLINKESHSSCIETNKSVEDNLKSDENT